LHLIQTNVAQSQTGLVALAVGIFRRARDLVLDFGRQGRVYGDKLIRLQDSTFTALRRRGKAGRQAAAPEPEGRAHAQEGGRRNDAEGLGAPLPGHLTQCPVPSGTSDPRTLSEQPGRDAEVPATSLVGDKGRVRREDGPDRDPVARNLA
jgi:hypothetical protein